jgi:hypothetical protein
MDELSSLGTPATSGPIVQAVDDMNIVTCTGVCVAYRRVLDWMIGFIARLIYS